MATVHTWSHNVTYFVLQLFPNGLVLDGGDDIGSLIGRSTFDQLGGFCGGLVRRRAADAVDLQWVHVDQLSDPGWKFGFGTDFGKCFVFGHFIIF